MPANPLRSIGFGQERLHSGLVAFLVDLYREGERQPLTGFLSGLGISIPDTARVRAVFEWHKADVGIDVIEDSHRTILVLEFKV